MRRSWLNLTLVFLLSGFLLAAGRAAAEPTTHNVILITFDGLRWQELFTGADPKLIGHEDYVDDAEALKQAFWRESAKERREVLLPFFWDTIAKQGSIFGNRDLGSHVRVANGYHFSYPGYSELLTGFVDPEINSNAKRWNRNVTLLEWLNEQPDFAGKVAAFGSWDVFPYIINTERSGLPVNAGFAEAEGRHLPESIRLLNRLQKQIPSPWATVRLDAFTHHYALHHLSTERPRFVYIAYGETDDFAHDGHYDQYLHAARRTDGFVGEIWQFVQSSTHYRDRTTLILTTDHGRGTEPLETWRSHASAKGAEVLGLEAGIVGSEQIWLAVLGPDSPALGEVREEHPEIEMRQIAATAAQLLGVDYVAAQTKAAPPVDAVLPGTPSTRIAFGSCAHQDRPQPIWDAIVEDHPDVFLMLGDNVYGDTEDMKELAAKYAKLGAKPGFQRLRRQTPVLATWDDHDLGANDAGQEYPFKEESRRILLDFFEEPADSPRRQQPDGLYGSHRLQVDERSVQILLLDLRWNRTPLKGVDEATYQRVKAPKKMGPYEPIDESDAVLLGEGQWRWLEERLREPADLRILASSIQLLADFTGWESWANFPHERQRLFDLIRTTGAENVVLVSGDTHWAELSQMSEGLPYPLWEVTSSGLTEEWKDVSPNRNRVGAPYAKANYGLLEIVWDAAEPYLQASIKDVHGNVVIATRIVLTDLAL